MSAVYTILYIFIGIIVLLCLISGLMYICYTCGDFCPNRLRFKHNADGRFNVAHEERQLIAAPGGQLSSIPEARDEPVELVNVRSRAQAYEKYDNNKATVRYIQEPTATYQHCVTPVRPAQLPVTNSLRKTPKATAPPPPLQQPWSPQTTSYQDGPPTYRSLNSSSPPPPEEEDFPPPPPKVSSNTLPSITSVRNRINTFNRQEGTNIHKAAEALSNTNSPTKPPKPALAVKPLIHSVPLSQRNSVHREDNNEHRNHQQERTLSQPGSRRNSLTKIVKPKAPPPPPPAMAMAQHHPPPVVHQHENYLTDHA